MFGGCGETERLLRREGWSLPWWRRRPRVEDTGEPQAWTRVKVERYYFAERLQSGIRNLTRSLITMPSVLNDWRTSEGGHTGKFQDWKSDVMQYSWNTLWPLPLFLNQFHLQSAFLYIGFWNLIWIFISHEMCQVVFSSVLFINQRNLWVDSTSWDNGSPRFYWI